MPRIDRYLTREIVPPFLVAVALVVIAVFLFQARRLATAALGLGLTLEDAAIIFVSALPPFLMLAVPIAYLLAVLVGLGRLGQDLELVALRASGASPMRIARVPILVGALVSAITIPIAVYGEPYGLRLLHARLVDVGLRNLTSAIEPGTFNEDFRGSALYAATRDESGKLGNVLLYDERDREQPVLLAARTGTLDAESARGIGFELEHGEIHLAARASSEKYDRIRFERARLGLDAEQEISKRVQFVSTLGRLTSDEIFAEIERRGASDPVALRMAKTHWRRFAFPSMAFVLGLVGAAIALGGTVRSRARSAVLGMVAVVGYYILTRIADFVLVQGRVSPFWTAWLPNLLLLAIGLFALVRGGRPRA